MVNDQRQALPENARSLMTTGRFIQFALMASTLIYGLVANVMSMEGEPEISDPDGMQMIFSILGIGSCFIASLANRYFLSAKRLGDSGDPSLLTGKIFVGFVITWAIAESCAVFGLLLTIMLKDASLYTTFGALSFLTILAHPMTEARVRSLMKR